MAKMTLSDLADILESAAKPNQGLSYYNGRPEQRFDQITGEPYLTRDRTELRLFGTRANNFYRILENAKTLAEAIRRSQP